ncbi:MAG: putative photosynthetic complex assembly protein PuhE [Pseudomonadota bacterium]
MVEHLYPALFALFIWWLSTGVIIYLDGLPQHTFKWSMIGATLILFGSLYGIAVTADDTTIQGAYLAFTFGLLAWGWQQISFFMGFVTGPRKEDCPEDCQGITRFWYGVQVGLWHDLAIIVAFVAIAAMTWDAANQVGLWTFAVLWWMHQSAKLNVFFGVRNLNEEFIPEHMAYVRSYLKKRPMNLLFPISVSVSTIICAFLFEQSFAADATPFEAAGYTFLGVMMALAIVEHWFLVLPIPAGKLWQWSLKSRKPAKQVGLGITAKQFGFFGQG